MKTPDSNSQNHRSAVSILLGASVEFSISTIAYFFSFLKSLVMFVACLVFSHHTRFWIYYSIPLLSLSANIEYAFKSFILPILDFSLYLLTYTVLSFLGLQSVS